MKFKPLSGDVNWHLYGGKWVSTKQNNGKFDYWLVLELINWHYAVGKSEAPARYYVGLSAVAPSEAGEAKIAEAFAVYGLDYEDLKIRKDPMAKNPMALVEALHGNEVFTLLWSDNGDSYRKLMSEAKKRAEIANCMFGFGKRLPEVDHEGWTTGLDGM